MMSTRLRAARALGLAASVLAAVHGAFEVTRGTTSLPGLRFCATGGAFPSAPSFAKASRCLPAESVFGTYLTAGIVTLLVAIAMGWFVTRRLDRRFGGAITFAFAVALLLSGGGNFAPILGVIASVLVLSRATTRVTAACSE